MRSAFLTYGAEMINNAFYKDWVCTSHCCGVGSGEQAQTEATRRANPSNGRERLVVLVPRQRAGSELPKTLLSLTQASKIVEAFRQIREEIKI